MDWAVNTLDIVLETWGCVLNYLVVVDFGVVFN